MVGNAVRLLPSVNLKNYSQYNKLVAIRYGGKWAKII